MERKPEQSMNADEGGGRGDREGRGDRGDREGGGRSFGRGFGRKKVCPFTADKTIVLDYKNIKVISRFVTETGRIVPRHVTGVNAKNQRKLAKFIKRARNLGILAPKAEG